MKKVVVAVLGLLALQSCKKDPVVIPEGKYEEGILVLNEGLYQQNNASLSYYTPGNSQVTQQVFNNENGRGLGDVANDMDYYTIGDSAYIIIAVDLSSQLEIVNARTLKSVAQIPLFDGAIAREPRLVQAYGLIAYSCNYDGTVSVIDLVSNKVVNTIDVGANPDGMAVVGQKLYTANSGGLNWPVYDSTVSVVNLNSGTVESTIQSRVNCTKMIADSEGDIYIVSNGNYNNIAPAMIKLNTQTNQITEEHNVSISSWCLDGEWIYYHDSNNQGVYRFNTLTETFEGTQIIDVSSYQTMYAVQVTDNNIITADGNGYTNSATVRVYSKSGSFQYEFTAGFLAKEFVQY
jgi:YVTN family beta-propeller protein